jgi:uncharacterized protein YbaR (Trm112 family)
LQHVGVLAHQLHVLAGDTFRDIYNEAKQELVSRAARLAFPIRDGVPVMISDEARAVDDEELRTLGKR